MLFAFWLGSGLTFAQEIVADSIQQIEENDTIEVQIPDGPNPTKAALYSAVLPGLGQIYNKRYWMLPIIYGGAYTLGYFVDFNNDLYNERRSALFAVRSGNIDPTNPLHLLSETALENGTDEARRNRDLVIAASIASYLFVIVEAYTNAHLKNFPKIKKLSLTPDVDMTPYGTPSTGLALIYKF